MIKHYKYSHHPYSPLPNCREEGAFSDFQIQLVIEFVEEFDLKTTPPLPKQRK